MYKLVTIVIWSNKKLATINKLLVTIFIWSNIELATCSNLLVSMVAYFCHYFSDNYVDLSDIFVDLSDLYVDLSLINLLENES